jgi:hypothetical protein
MEALERDIITLNQLNIGVDDCHHMFLPAFPVPTASQTCSQNGHAGTCSYL